MPFLGELARWALGKELVMRGRFFGHGVSPAIFSLLGPSEARRASIHDFLDEGGRVDGLMREGEVRVGAATAIAHMANKDHVREAMCQHAVESRELRLPFVFERLSARARDRVFASQIGHPKGFDTGR